MIKFTGLLEANGAYYKDGYLVLTPHLAPFGITTLDVSVQNLEQVHRTGFGYQSIPKEIFDTVEPSEGNYYDKVIAKLEAYVIEDLEAKNPDVTFEIVSAPKQEEHEQPTDI